MYVARLASGSALLAVVAAGVPSVYLALLTAVAAGTGGRPSTPSLASTRFVICVPAHNESAVISRTVVSLLAQRYPRSLFAVHVVADNCDDDTAERAVCAGAVVHKRVNPDDPGKGPALNWLAERLATTEFDALVVVDADTTADVGFLAALDRSVTSGATVAQAHYGVEDSSDSPAVGLRFAAIACRHHLRPLARNAFGASCGLYGNGMAFRADVLEGRRWSNHLIEDAEFQIELLLDGHLVTYVPEAILRAEMPDSLAAGRSQNERWELGRLRLARDYIPPLMRTTVAGGELPRRVYADAVADLASPPLSVQVLLDGAAVALAFGALAIRPCRTNRLLAISGLASTAIMGAHLMVGLRLVHAPASVYRSLWWAPRAILWKLRLLGRVAQRPESVTWTRTQRNSDESGRR